MTFLRQIFVWWHGATLGTRLTTLIWGERVGEDEYGNTYFQNRGAKRRWVIYAGTVEASRVSPDWHGWMHHTFPLPPTEAPLKVQPWEKEYRPNLSGTSEAYRPDGSLYKSGQRPPATGDYEAWRPS